MFGGVGECFKIINESVFGYHGYFSSAAQDHEFKKTALGFGLEMFYCWTCCFILWPIIFVIIVMVGVRWVAKLSLMYIHLAD